MINERAEKSRYSQLPKQMACSPYHELGTYNANYLVPEHWKQPSRSLCHPKSQQKDVNRVNSKSELDERGFRGFRRRSSCIKPRRVWDSGQLRVT